MPHLNGGGNGNEAFFNVNKNFYNKFPGNWGEVWWYIMIPWMCTWYRTWSLVWLYEGGIDCIFGRGGREGGLELILTGVREVEVLSIHAQYKD